MLNPELIDPLICESLSGTSLDFIQHFLFSQKCEPTCRIEIIAIISFSWSSVNLKGRPTGREGFSCLLPATAEASEVPFRNTKDFGNFQLLIETTHSLMA
jgi:hypothetical protein